MHIILIYDLLYAQNQHEEIETALESVSSSVSEFFCYVNQSACACLHMCGFVLTYIIYMCEYMHLCAQACLCKHECGLHMYVHVCVYICVHMFMNMTACEYLYVCMYMNKSTRPANAIFLLVWYPTVADETLDVGSSMSDFSSHLCGRVMGMRCVSKVEFQLCFYVST